LGCYGSEIDTPCLDALAVDGLRFSQFYNCGRCCPTRAALLTGLYPHQAGVGHMEEDLGDPAYRGYLNQSCATIAEALRPAGYHSYAVGKWNVGYRRPHWPGDRGFARYFGLLRGASDYFDPRVGPRAKMSLFARDDQIVNTFPDDFYLTEAISDDAIRYVREAPVGEPLFLYVAYTAPHSPLQARPADIAKYRGRYRDGWNSYAARRRERMRSDGMIRSADAASADGQIADWSTLSPEQQDFEDLKMAVYAAQVETMDRGIGRIVGALREKQILDDTLILFLSDNGGDGNPEGATAEPPGPKGSSHIYGRAWARVSNTPLRGYKREMWEGGIASPLIVHWPRGLKQRGVTHEPGHVIDILPTCLELARAEYPQRVGNRTITPTAGRSLAPIFETCRREPHEFLFWEHEGHRAVRHGDWKLISPQGRSKSWQLYDLATDRVESRNVAAVHADIVTKLRQAYETWAERVGVVPWDELRSKP
jgi:arylsulfatase